MSNVWISKESWERLWNAMHNVQIRFSRLLSHPSGGITGDGLSAQFRIDLPERLQETPRQWMYSLTDLGNETWKVEFFSYPDPIKAGCVKYRGTTYNIYRSDCTFTLSKSDLSSGHIFFVMVKQVYVYNAEGVTFVPRLSRSHPAVNGPGADQYCLVAEFAYSESRQSMVVYTYQDKMIEWYNYYYRNDQMRLDIAFGPTPASTDGFVEFLNGAVQYLLIDEHFCIMVNGIRVNLSDSIPYYRTIQIDQYYQAGKSYLYVYWACDITANNYDRSNLPSNARFEILPYELNNSELEYYRYRRVHIPVMSISANSFPAEWGMAQTMFYRASDYVSPTNIPIYWVNTCGLDFYPGIQDGWISINFTTKKVIINSIRCYGDDTRIGMIPRQEISFENHMPLSGSLSVCCVFDPENNRWGTPYLKNGSAPITPDESGVTGSECSVEIARITGYEVAYANIRQNYSGPVRLFSYKYRINKLRADLTSALATINTDIKNIKHDIQDLYDRIDE